ncbi:MAG: DUF1073 domain-containing protein [Treponema sp.]|jgi:hypothetical protein|nr:DUF1073 domain-containing protein [Treponema sp.]
MLEYAKKHEDRLRQLFLDTAFDPYYQYEQFINYREVFELPKDAWQHYHFASVFNNDVQGFIAYNIKRAENSVWGLHIIHFGGPRAPNSYIFEFSVGKYKLANLADILSQTDGAELIKKRVEVMDYTRSVFHSMYFDKDDDFYWENVSFAGVPEVLHIMFMLVSSCTGYPITRLFGVSPAGMNATGESDMRNYYDKVRSKQAAEAAPILLRLARIISEWKKIPEPYIIWKPLQQLSRKEQAEVEKLEADKEQVKAGTYQAYINAGIMEPYEARFLEFGDTLDKIPVPEDLLPQVQPVPEVPPGGEEGQEGEAPEDDENGEGDP